MLFQNISSCRASPSETPQLISSAAATISAIWTFTQLIWAWRNVAGCSFVRILPALLTAVFSLGAFTVAGGFSSSISSGISDEVLLNGHDCGIIQYTVFEPQSASIIVPYFSHATHSAANYAKRCYPPDSDRFTDSAGTLDCKYFVRDHLHSTVDTEAPCPFHDNTICRENNANIRLDTGYLSLVNDLGSNAPPEQDILLRTIWHCAPLQTQGYTEMVLGLSDNFTSYNYGSYTRGKNYTYMAETLEAQYKKQGENPFHDEGRSFILK